MKVIVVHTAAVVTFMLVASFVIAQELVPTPDPVGGAKAKSSPAPQADEPTQPAPTKDPAVATKAEAWRYRWFNNRWWYWTPEKRWMWYSDDGRWIEFDAQRSAPAVASEENFPPRPVYGCYYAPPLPYLYPQPGYWYGAYPGVAVGVRPYGNVNVGVGRRVGVDVWGPHGAVRVGRTYIGW